MKFIRNSLKVLTAFLGLSLGIPAAYAGEEATVVTMETNFGKIVLELDAEKAPKTVENFVQYVKDGFFDDTIFHRVIDGFMIQGGGFTADYQQKKTRDPIENEANNGLKNERGTIAMARTSDPHSATAQFFINVKDNNFLNFSQPTMQGWGYTVFGKVVEGMDVVDKIKNTPTGSGGPFPTDVPQTQVIIEKVSLQDKTGE
jgi:cyclophilin family peptidyl-prolyl cis-trans isomerase